MPKVFRDRKSIIRKFREHSGLFQSELAEMLDCGQDSVSRYECFNRNIPMHIRKKLVEIAAKYGFKLTLKMLENDCK